MQEEITDNIFKNVLLYVLFFIGLNIFGFIIVQILIFLVDIIGYAAQDIVVWISQQ